MTSARYLNIHGLSRRYSTAIAASICVLLLFIYVHAFDRSSKLTASQWPSNDPDPPEHTGGIPSQIWQIFFGYSPLDELVNVVQTWPTKNQNYAYTLLDGDGAERFARKYYSNRPEVLGSFLDIQIPVLRSDLLRYMLLESEGGVYSDLDTAVIKPIKEWVPDDLKADVRAIVGIEYDQGNREPYIGMHEPIQFCQWTMASSPRHPIMKKVVKLVVQELNALAERNHTTIKQLEPSDGEVIKVTGPFMWTRAVLDSLSEATGTTVSHLNVSDITEPKLFGDVLILPINGFGSGQPHSNSWRGEGDAPDALVRHLWKGSWKHGWPGSWARSENAS